MESKVPLEKRSKALQYYYDNIERLRAEQRIKAKQRYYLNKEKKLLANAEYRKNNPEKWKAIKQVSNAKYNKRRFFFVRALGILARTSSEQDALHFSQVLARAWYNQRGRCAYTGKRLDRSAEVDHKIPISKGGTNDPSNLHWVTAAANFVKRTMTHDEFINICTDIAAYIEKNAPKGLTRGCRKESLPPPPSRVVGSTPR